MRGLALELAFVPEATARRQIARIDEMLARIGDGDLLRWGTVVRGVTGFAPRAARDDAHTEFVGQALRHDLRELSLRLSARAPETLATAMTLAVLARRWRTTIRTVQRWRKRGLLCCMVRARGTLVVGVRSRDADAFQASHASLLAAPRHRRIAIAVRAQILRDAREAALSGERRITVAARVIATRTGVGRESVRRILAHTAADRGGVLAGRRSRGANAATIALGVHGRGGGTSALAKRLSLSTSAADRLSRRARRLGLLAISARLLPPDAPCPPTFERADAREVILAAACVRSDLVPLRATAWSEWASMARVKSSRPQAESSVGSARLLACRFLLHSVQQRVRALGAGEAPAMLLDAIDRDLRWVAAMYGALLRDAMPSMLARVAHRGVVTKSNALAHAALRAAAKELQRLVEYAPIEQLALGRVRVEQSLALAVDAALAAEPRHRPASSRSREQDPLAIAMPWSRALRALVRRVEASAAGTRERRLWEMRLGLDGKAPMTLQEVADAERVQSRTLAAQLARSLVRTRPIA